MKSIKVFSVIALTTLTVMAFAGASTAMAESTALCTTDENPCEAIHRMESVHEVSVGKAKLLTVINVECNVLFLGKVESANNLGSPLAIIGNFTYTNCGGCEVEEENGPTEIKVLRESHETASVTGEGLVHVNCPGLINCSYNGVGLKATAKGPLLATQENGEVIISEQTTNKETGGFLCPKKAKLDITMTPAAGETLIVGCEEIVDQKPTYIVN